MIISFLIPMKIFLPSKQLYKRSLTQTTRQRHFVNNDDLESFAKKYCKNTINLLKQAFNVSFGGKWLLEKNLSNEAP